MTSTPKKKLILASSFSFFLFIITVIIVNSGLFNPIDPAVTLALQAKIPVWIDPFFSTLSVVQSFEFSLIYVGLLFILIFLKEKKIFSSILLFFLIAIIELIGKIAIYHPGPPQEYLRNTFILRFPSSFIHTNYAFPSGHVGRTAFFAVIIIFLISLWIKNKTYRLIAYSTTLALFIIVFVSRISLGEHWLSDVIGGTFLGLSLGLLALFFW